MDGLNLWEATVHTLRRHRGSLALAAALILPLSVAAILVPFRQSFANTASALVLVAVIVAVAAIGSRTAGFLATLSATLWFDFFLTEPYGKFAITHRPDVEIAVSLFVVGMVVTELAARNRHHHEIATEESDYVGLIYRISELAASAETPEFIIEQVRTELVALLDLRACRFAAGAPEGPVLRIRNDGHVILASHLWGVHRVGLPGPELSLLVQAEGRTVGRFILTPTPGRPVSLEQRLVAVTLADQVGGVIRPRLRSA